MSTKGTGNLMHYSRKSKEMDGCIGFHHVLLKEIIGRIQ